IAIPEKLHKQGETFLQPSNSQKKSTEHPFLKDLHAYLKNLVERPKEFLNSENEYLEALGAFRTLYRQHKKQPTEIDGKYTSGLIPSMTFFKSSEDTKKIDQLFHDEIKTFIEKKEDLPALPKEEFEVKISHLKKNAK
ncbi:MAG: hypothetical protein ACNA7Y_03675, partial [Gammaproteobacteria bacterium]